MLILRRYFFDVSCFGVDRLSSHRSNNPCKARWINDKPFDLVTA
jgi:hypothetical protein